jgi:hypothetical protein
MKAGFFYSMIDVFLLNKFTHLVCISNAAMSLVIYKLNKQKSIVLPLHPHNTAPPRLTPSRGGHNSPSLHNVLFTSDG